VTEKSNLEHILTSGQFAVTGELGPPKNGDMEVVRRKARILKGHVDAVNITDCQTAIVRMSSLTAGLIALSEGVEPVMQMTCRDRNRIAIQAEALGAEALGIKNLLCLTGDHQKFGNHPQAKGVFDMDSIQLLTMMRQMRDERRFQCGEEIKGPAPGFFLGAAANPFADPFEFRPRRLAKKVAAGARFIQTQIIYNVDKFARFMEMVRDLGLHEKVYILAGITPPKSLGMARYMKNYVSGLDVTDEVIQRMRDARDQRAEGIQIAVDIIQQVREIPGVKGVHIMAIEWEEAVPEIVKLAGLGPRPEPKGVEPRLVSPQAIELAVSQAVEQAKASMEQGLEQVKKELQVSTELLAKEKDRAAQRVAALEKELQEAREMVAEKKSETAMLVAELNEAKNLLKNAASALAAAPVQVQALNPAAAGGVAVSGQEAALTPREQMALNALKQGLAALRKAMNLTEDQFEAIKQFLEAQFVLYLGAPMGIQAGQIPVQPVSTAVMPAQPVADVGATGRSPLQQGQVTASIATEKASARGAFGPKVEAAVSPVKPVTEPVSKPAAAVVTGAEGMPPCPEDLTQEEWRNKWLIRLIAKANVCLQRGDASGAKAFFEQVLALDAQNARAKAGLERIAAGLVPTSSAAASEALKEAARPVAEVEQPKAEPKPAPEPVKEVKPEVVVQKSEEKAAVVATAPAVQAASQPLPKEQVSLAERCGQVSKDLFMEPCSASIRPVTIGDGPKAITVGGASTLPFHLFEGEMPYAPKVAYDVLDAQPDEWPDVLSKYYADVFSDPAKWAQKCVKEYGAEAICLSLVSTDPNGMNRPASEAVKTVTSVLNAVDCPLVLWGCGNAEKDTETLREVTSHLGNRRVCIAPLTDANYRSLGATALGMNLPVVASTPIDVNLAKQLNILLENLGLPLENVLMDPSIGAVGYGMEYTYSVIERIRLAALTQQDAKLAVPFICNIGREVWKAKETKIASSDFLGDQERRGILMEAITASALLLAGGDLLIMRHPKAIEMTNVLVQAMM